MSEDAAVLALCREIARDIPSISWTFRLRKECPSSSDAELCLWDYKKGCCLPRDVSWGTRCFVLVASNDLAEFRAAHPFAEPGIILKPVTRAVLRAIITQRIPRYAGEIQSDGELLRSDRDELLQSLMQANLQLQEFEAQRNNFLGRALHDFHAPLTALSGYCGMLLEEKSGLLTDQQKLIVTRMHRSVRRLSRLSRAMFHLSVGRQIPAKPLVRETDIRECVEQAQHEIQQLADEKQIQIDLDLEPLPVPLLIDSSQIEQVTINLLENACKFSPRHGSITVKGYSCFCERRIENVSCPPDAERRHTDSRPVNTYRIDIVDCGPGVSPEQIDKIFEEYVTYAGERDHTRGGLGLAISRVIVEQHHGRIWAENCQSGAVFSFILPLQTPVERGKPARAGCERRSSGGLRRGA